MYDKIILIASRSDYTWKQIKKYNAMDHENALIVVFNTCLGNQRHLFGGKYNKRFIRGFGTHLRGNFKIKGNVQQDAEFYVWRHSNVDHIKKANGLQHCEPLQYIIPEQFYRPSMGYIAYDILGKEFPDIPIYLLGFTFQGFKIHDWKLEKQILTTDPRVHVI